jgi:hypothetical protein
VTSKYKLAPPQKSRLSQIGRTPAGMGLGIADASPPAAANEIARRQVGN